jgi:hypothetical protein
MWIDTVKNKGFLKENLSNTQLKQDDPLGKQVQTSTETQRNAITNAYKEPTILSVNNSRTTGTGGGQVNLTLSKNAVVRNDETTLRTCQYQSLRLVH